MAKDSVPFPYMRWAKANLPLDDPLSLGLSAVARPGRDDVPALTDPLPRDGPNPEAAWKEALETLHGLGPGSVHPTCGASHANFLVYLAFARGGRVAAETPAYEAFHRLGAAVGAEVRPFRRAADRNWRIDPDDLARAVAPGAGVLAVTDLHNPSGARLHPDDLDLLVEAAEKGDAVVLVDEVFLDLDPEDRPSAATRHPRVLVTSSLTKSHGMWDLRAGWVLGRPSRVAEVERWDDLVCPRLPLLALKEALAYLPFARAQIERIRERSARATERVDAWVRGRSDVWWTRPPAGFTGFLRLGPPHRPLDADRVASTAWEDSGIRVVPGRFFQASTWIRISYLLDDDPLERALEGLGRALDQVGRAQASRAASSTSPRATP